jgi:hypothetical protein
MLSVADSGDLYDVSLKLINLFLLSDYYYPLLLG